MKCEICNENEAIIHVQQIIGSDVLDLHLCEQCAMKKGITTRNDKLELSLSRLLSNVLEKEPQSTGKQRVCANCGLVWNKIRKDKIAGCPFCFEHFRNEIGRMIEDFSDETAHKGKLPRNLRAIKTILVDKERLQKDLKVALKTENYEAAAVLRDMIRNIEQSAGGEDD